MRLRLVRFGLTALVCVGAAAMLAPAQSPQQEKRSEKENSPRDGWKLVWADEFDYTGLPDPAKWDYEVGYIRNNEAQYYTRARKENAWVEGGVLTITGRKEKFAIPPGGRGNRKGRTEADYTAASLITRDKASWTYGRIELRAKLPKGRGVWPAFWALGTSGGWPRGGEIDIMEYYRGMLLANAAWGSATRGRPVWDDSRKPLTSFGDPDWSRKFHIWRMDWDDTSLTLAVDNQVLKKVDLSKTINQDAEAANPFHQAHYMILNLAIGGSNGGDPSATAFPAKFEVDYVRVYQKQSPNN